MVCGRCVECTNTDMVGTVPAVASSSGGVSDVCWVSSFAEELSDDSVVSVLVDKGSVVGFGGGMSVSLLVCCRLG